MGGTIMTRSLKLTLLLACVLVLASWAAPAQAQICGTPETVTLVAGQHIDSGLVIVSNDANFIYVEYATNDPWSLIEAHLAIADSLGGIPQTKKGNPIPGRFPYSATFNPEVTDYIFTVPIGGFTAGESLYIAAHGVVVSSAGGSETAWGAGIGFPGANWATYLQYTVQSCSGGVE
jgi:hypothetical protein